MLALVLAAWVVTMVGHLTGASLLGRGRGDSVWEVWLARHRRALWAGILLAVAAGVFLALYRLPLGLIMNAGYGFGLGAMVCLMRADRDSAGPSGNGVGGFMGGLRIVTRGWLFALAALLPDGWFAALGVSGELARPEGLVFAGFAILHSFAAAVACRAVRNPSASARRLLPAACLFIGFAGWTLFHHPEPHMLPIILACLTGGVLLFVWMVRFDPSRPMRERARLELILLCPLLVLPFLA